MPDDAYPVAVAVRDLTVTYGDRLALDSVSLDIPAGSVFGLLGPNGSGKTTLLASIATMKPRPAGVLTVFGAPPRLAFRGQLGVVFQEPSLDPLMTPLEILRLAGRLYGMPGAALLARGTELLEAVGLSDRSHDRVLTLSGGMRRRLDVARALVHRPALLLLDEPATGVDPEERRALWALVRDAAGPRGAVILATNDLAEAQAVCTHVAFLRHGRVLATGRPDELTAGLKGEALNLTWPGATDDLVDELQRWEGIGNVARDGDRVRITADAASALAARLFAAFPGQISALAVESASLEDAYFALVAGRGHGDGGRGAP